MRKWAKDKIVLICKFCKKDFLVFPSGLNRIYCSKKCSSSMLIGNKIWLGRKHSNKTKIKLRLLGTGRKLSEDAKEKLRLHRIGKKLPEHIKNKISISHIGEKNYRWQGNNISYKGIHNWVKRRLGSPNKCLHCGKIGEKNNRNWNIQWANKSHKYLRDLNDWIGLCCKCHKNYDKKYMNLLKK